MSSTSPLHINDIFRWTRFIHLVSLTSFRCPPFVDLVSLTSFRWPRLVDLVALTSFRWPRSNSLWRNMSDYLWAFSCHTDPNSGMQIYPGVRNSPEFLMPLKEWVQLTPDVFIPHWPEFGHANLPMAEERQPRLSELPATLPRIASVFVAPFKNIYVLFRLIQIWPRCT